MSHDHEALIADLASRPVETARRLVATEHALREARSELSRLATHRDNLAVTVDHVLTTTLTRARKNQT